jgi:predicted GTPase
MKRKRILILGAAGRDFHNFNTVYRDNREVEVVAFTATQIPEIAGRRYPTELAGELYPKGIAIEPEENMEKLIADHKIDEVVFSYSDVSHETVMHLASRAIVAGANFTLLNAADTMLKSSKPVIGVLAVRTGSGKSQVSRYIAQKLRDLGKKAISIRHPMPYGADLRKQTIERFATYADLDHYECTIEEREEYESYIDAGLIIYAGVDYQAILTQAEKEADVIIWDGGNNDLPFIKPDLWITVADPLRPGHEVRYHPGEANLRAADVIVLNKANVASPEQIKIVQNNIHALNPKAEIVVAASEISVDQPDAIKGKRVLCIDDGPTLTHGEMSFGAGQSAATQFGAAEIVNPKSAAVGSIAEAFVKYPHIGKLLPAVGYFPQQLRDLETSIRNTDCDLVIIATPTALQKVIKIDKPFVRVRYELADLQSPTLAQIIEKFVSNS